MLAHIPDISGAKRKQNLTAHAEDARISKQLATVDRGVPLDFDPTAEAAREPDRSRLREVFREYELRDPLRRLEEALGEAELAVPVGPTEVRLSGRVRAGAADIARVIIAADSTAVSRSCASRCARPRCPRARCSRRAPVALRGLTLAGGRRWPRRRLRFRRAGRRAGGRAAGGAVRRLRERRGGRAPPAGSCRWSCTTPRRSGWCRPASSTTRCWAPTCWSPRGAATRSRSCARSAGLPPTWRTPRPARRCWWGRWRRGSASRSPSAAWRG